MSKELAAILAISLLLLASGCAQTPKGGTDLQLDSAGPAQEASETHATPNQTAPITSPNASADRTTSPDRRATTNSDIANATPAPPLANASAQLLDVNKRFLVQTALAEAEAEGLNFSRAADWFNRSSFSARNLTALLKEVCRQKGANCTNQLEGYANIAVCAKARGDYYSFMDALMPVLRSKLACAQKGNGTNISDADCSTNDLDYQKKCQDLRVMAQMTEMICQPVAGQMDLANASELICQGAK